MHTTDKEKSYIRQLVITYHEMERIKVLMFLRDIYITDSENGLKLISGSVTIIR